MNQVHGAVDRGRRRSTVDREQGLGGGSLENGRNGPRAWNLAAIEEKGGGNGGEPHRLQEGAAEGRKRLGIGGEKPAEEALGAGGAQVRREEKRGGERSSEARGGCSPFYRGLGGACWGEKGGNGQWQWP
jgi:hypothetical protein